MRLNPIIEPLRPHDALKGGRTNAIKLYHKCGPNEKIMYIDFTSLYPAVQKQQLYPIGHPDIIHSDFGQFYIGKYFGLIKLSILPPRKLFLPVLPATIDGKLLFTLCAACAMSKQENCDHPDEQRIINGTWVSIEVDYAVKKGYRVYIRIFEVWNWPNRGDLFTDSDYVNSCIKEKQEASGYPEKCTDVAAKFKYVADYCNKEGVQLDMDKICSDFFRSNY
jgi:hypothetical protein